MPVDGPRIRKLRQQHGIRTAADLARAIGISPPHMRNLENGNRLLDLEAYGAPLLRALDTTLDVIAPQATPEQRRVIEVTDQVAVTP